MPPWDGEVTEAAKDDRSVAASPRLADWLWRRWYAKLWWILIVLFWLGAFAAQWITALQPVFHADSFPVVFLLLHPFAAIPVLCFGFARAWIAYHAPELEPGDAEDIDIGQPLMLRYRGVSQLDPFEPTSIACPLNPANSVNRSRRLRRH
jgi:hypothetical protein